MSKSAKSVRDEVVLMCNGKKCCPKATLYYDGTMEIVDTDDGKNDRVHLTAEQTKALRDQMNRWVL